MTYKQKNKSSASRTEEKINAKDVVLWVSLKKNLNEKTDITMSVYSRFDF